MCPECKALVADLRAELMDAIEGIRRDIENLQDEVQ